MIDYLFGKKYQMMVFIDPEKADRTEEVFDRYKARQTFSGSARRVFNSTGFSIDFAHSEPNKVTLCYLVDSCDVPQIKNDLLEGEVTGHNLHNPILTRPYGIRSKIIALIEEAHE